MSTDIVTPPAEAASRPAQRDGRPTLPRLLRSEWFADAGRPLRHATGDRWFVDETYVKVAGRWRHL